LHAERAAPTRDKESVRGQSRAAQCIPFATRLIPGGMTLPMMERLFATRGFKPRSFTANCAKDSNEAAIFAGEAEAGSGLGYLKAALTRKRALAAKLNARRSQKLELMRLQLRVASRPTWLSLELAKDHCFLFFAARALAFAVRR
jgi:hypothetical protein